MKNKCPSNYCWLMAILSFVTLAGITVAAVHANGPDSVLSVTDAGRPPTDKKVVRDFVLHNYARLANDIVNGEGVYLDTLYDILLVTKSQRVALRKQFQRILIEKKRIPEFSNCVAGYETVR